MRKSQTLLMTAFAVLLLCACSDWGQMDPPAGNQVFPKLERVSSYAFNTDLDDTFQLFAYPSGNMPALYSDEEHGSVLHLNGGYLQTDNPLNDVRIQNGVSLTFWIKQAVPEEGEEQDLEGAIFAFGNENASLRLFFTASGRLRYDGIDGTYEYDPLSVKNDAKTGLLTPGEWHYVALLVTNTGYFVHVDGEQVIDHTETEFDCSKIVEFMASAPKLFIGYGSDTQPGEMWLSNFAIYRNQITYAQIRVPNVGGGGGEVKNYIIVGLEDRSTPWWSAFSDLVTITGDQTINFGFYNHTNGTANWNNYLIVVTNGRSFGEAGYAEYFVLRADAWGWGDGHSNDNISHNFNWDNFRDEINGAWIDLSIKRTDNRLDLTAVATTTGKTVYTMTYHYEGNLEGTIGAFLTCEGSYLEIDPEKVFAGNVYNPGSYVVGPADLSAGWWQHFSEFTKITGNTPYPFCFNFVNNTNGAANWNNWVLVVTNGLNRGDDGYGPASEYFVLRADAYGWGGNHVGANISHDYNWDTYTTDMKNATCEIFLTRNGNRIDMTAKTTTTTGTVYTMTYFCEGVTTPDIGIFFTLEGASLDFRKVGYYPFLK